jgi:hypothetical protein
MMPARHDNPRRHLARWGHGGIFGNWLGAHRPRGAAVPFEAPALRMARVCDDERDGLIAILRDFGNNGAAYIVPWTSLALMVPMTVHDTALHKEIGERKPSTPAEVRAVVSGLALSGALGPEAKAREEERTQSDRTQVADIELVLLLHLLSSCGANLATLAADPARWGATNGKAAAAAAATVGIRRQDIYQRISELARLLEPVGLIATEGPVRPGWLRVLYDEIAAFGRNCRIGSEPSSPEINAALGEIVRSATRTAQLSGVVLSMIDYAVLDISATIRRWNTEKPVLKQAIDQLSLMLDEWPTLIKTVHDVLREPQGDMLVKLRSLRAVVRHPHDVDVSADDDALVEHAGSAAVSQVLATKLSAIWSMMSTDRPSQGDHLRRGGLTR